MFDKHNYSSVARLTVFCPIGLLFFNAGRTDLGNL